MSNVLSNSNNIRSNANCPQGKRQKEVQKTKESDSNIVAHQHCVNLCHKHFVLTFIEIQIINYGFRCEVLEADVLSFKGEKYIYTNPLLKHCQSLLTFAAAHCECHLRRSRFTTYVTPKSCEQSAEQTVMSALNMHGGGIPCSGCIGVIDLLHSHYHKLLFIARLVWWWCNIITQSCGTSFSNPP